MLNNILNNAREKEVKTKPKFELSRSVPTLCSSLGASPGNKHKHPDYEELAGEWPLVKAALEVGQLGRAKRMNKKGNVTALPALDQPKVPIYFTCSSPKFTTKSGATAQGHSLSPSGASMLNRLTLSPSMESKLSRSLPSSPQSSKK